MPGRPVRLLFRASACALALSVACARDAGPSPSYVQSLRCGMTRAEVTTLAQQYGYERSDESWLTRALRRRPARPKQLTLVDLTFREGRLVGVREGRYDPRTRQTAYRQVDLCGKH